MTDQQGRYQAVADYGGDGVGFEIVDRLSRAALATVLRLRR